MHVDVRLGPGLATAAGSARLRVALPSGATVATLLDRPAVPPIMAVLWYLDIVPGSLALVFSVQDFGGFLWTLAAWRAEQRAVEQAR